MVIELPEKVIKPEGNMLEQKIYVSYGDKPKELIKEVISNLKIESYIKKDAVNVPDCPPTAKDIIDILKHKLNS